MVEWVNLKTEFSPKHTANRKKQGQDPATVNITINYPIAYENAIQELILEDKERYPSRSGVIREAIGLYLKENRKFHMSLFKRLRKK